MRALSVQFTPEGMFLPELDLWLDPGAQSVDFAWFSHAHGDHARWYPKNVFATPETFAFYRLRWPENPQVTQTHQPLEFGKPIQFRDATLTAFPAAHIVGAAQLLIERQGYRLLYTGDIKARTPICGRQTEPVRCHRLIIESTFGLPIYHFHDHQQARERITAFATQALADGATPVFYGYSLGRGQEIAHVLATAGIPTALHGAMVKFLPGYEAAGYAFPGWTPYDARRINGRALVLPGAMRDILESSGADFRIAYVSGWAALASARARAGAHELIPYSDHGDFTELLDLIAACSPEQIDIVHGYSAPFAAILRSRGWDASAPLAASTRAEEEETRPNPGSDSQV